MQSEATLFVRVGRLHLYPHPWMLVSGGDLQILSDHMSKAAYLSRGSI